MSLRWQIALTLAAIALGVGTFAAAASYLSTGSQLRTSIDDNLRSRAGAANGSEPGGRGGPHGGGGPQNDVDCPSPGSLQPASAAQIVSATGAATSCISGGPSLPVLSADARLRSGQVVLRTMLIGGQTYRVLSTPWREGGTLQIARSLAETDDVLNRLRWQLVALVGAATLVTAALGWAIATRIARPITRLRDATENIATTLNLSAPMTVGGSGEVRSLAASFAGMIGAVRRSQDKQRRLVADASHEMRTPLTSLRSNVELLGRIEELPQAERREVVHDVLEDIDELSSLLGELVDLASDLADVEPSEPVSLGELARLVAHRTSRRFERIVQVQEPRTADVVGRPRQLERAINNLVDNAVKYSGRNDAVDIVVDGPTVTVLDRGRGIPDADLERIFDRFYRAVDVRSDPGSGLGLAIVDEIVRSHGGQVFAAHREGGGAAVGFRLPASP
jgi:two-component system, OmpR family, sensor histidine kinase MprB